LPTPPFIDANANIFITVTLEPAVSARDPNRLNTSGAEPRQPDRRRLANVEVQRQRSPLTIEILAPTFM
jgi:hypothetical protein